MGDFNVRSIQNKSEKAIMHKHAIDDIDTFQKMLDDKVFDKGPLMIGAEQEICLIDDKNEPQYTALEILDKVNDDAYTNELALFNLEINLSPKYLKNSCFSDVEKELLLLLAKGTKVADQLNTKFLLTGILPTLKYRHLTFDNMTPVERYKTLSKALLDLRGSDFDIYLQGVDELIISLESVLFEACNTSFQLHLQIDPDEFVDKHNWSQMISGPVLSVATNSPLLFGNDLWSETRIALFKQSLDTRHGHNSIRRKLPRVYFGYDWIKTSAAELWKNDLMRFPLIVTSDQFDLSSDQYSKGIMPKLRAIRLHNGTTYTWNRLCYGFSGKKPHLRIECRYIPAGPSPIDEVANFAFWVGLMCAEPPQGKKFWKNIDFQQAKSNFIKASRTGLQSVFDWYGVYVPAKELILETLLPMARKGLESMSVSEYDINKYLSVIEQRVQTEQTGNKWQVKRYYELKKTHGETNALQNMVQEMYDHQSVNKAVHNWTITNSLPVKNTPKQKIEDIMTTDLITVTPDMSVRFAKQLLDWKNIHHLPVENSSGELMGIITDGILNRATDEDFIEDIMIKDIVSIAAKNTIEEGIEILHSEKLSCVPVVYQDRLVGIITENDLRKVFE